MSAPTYITGRKEALAPEEAQAQLYLRDFDPKRYDGYYRRLYDPTAFLDNVGIEKITELIEHGNGVLNVAEALNLSATALRKWLNHDKTRIEKVRLAHVFAGNAYAYKAERTLLEVRHGSKEEIAWAGKMADHYRWMATKLDREMFGEVKDSEKAKGSAPLVVNLNMGGGVENEKLVNAKKPVLTAEFMKLTDEVEVGKE